MSIITDVLAAQVSHFFESSAAVENRILIPALTDELGKKLHSKLSNDIDKSIPVYLVVDAKKDKPDETTKWITAEGITTKRKGSFVLIVQPGLFSYINESILRAIQIGFDDEWPWVDNHRSLLFDFDSIILPKLCRKSALCSEASQSTFENILRNVTASLRDTSDKNQFYFETIIDKVMQEPPVDGVSEIDQLLFALKIPAGTFDNSSDIDSFNIAIKDIGNIGKEAFSKSRSYLKEESETSDNHSVIDRIYDGIGSAKENYGGLLRLHSALSKFPLEEWVKVDIKFLKNLFDVKALTKVSLEVEFDLQSASSEKNGLVSSDFKSLVMKQDSGLGISIKALLRSEDVNDEGGESPFEVEINCASKVIWSDSVASSNIYNYSRTVDFNISDDSLFGQIETGKSKKLTVKLYRSGQMIAKSSSLSLWMVGEKFSHYAVVQDPFTVIFPRKDEKDLNPSVIQLTSPSHVYFTSFDQTFDQPAYLEDFVSGVKELKIKKVPTSAILHNLGEALNPADSIAGKLAVSVVLDDEKAFSLELTTEVSSKGYFSVEDAFLGSFIEGKYKDLLSLFSGEVAETYSKLGDINDSSSLRVSISKLMEDVSPSNPGHLPFCIDLSSPRSKLPRYIENFWSSESLAGLKIQFGPAISDEGDNLIRNYTVARAKIINFYKSKFDHSEGVTRHPLYARVPTFIEKYSSEIETIILAYMCAYKAVLEHLSSKLPETSRSEEVILSALDCVNLYGGKDIAVDVCGYDLSLVGPWHPLQVSFRYMRQRAIFYSAQRDLSSNFHVNKMAGIFKEIRGLACLFGMTDHNSFAHAQVSNSSDSGWSVSRLARGNSSFSKFAISVKSKFGIDIAEVKYTSPNQINTFITDFMFSNPSERRLEIFIREGFDSEEVITAVSNLVRKPSNGFAEQLTGGVHLYFEDLSDFEDSYEWYNPIVCVYQVKSEKDCLRQNHIDILVVAPKRDDELIPLISSDFSAVPMGTDIASVLTSPYSVLVEGVGSAKARLQEGPYINGESNDDINNSLLELISLLPELVDNNGIRVQTDIELPKDISASWVVLPGGTFDPSVLSDFVNASNNQDSQKVLWEYNVDLTAPNSEYFILSEVAEGFDQSISISDFSLFDKKKLISDLSKVGIAIGGEALRSGTKALGVLGQVAAVRLFDDTSSLSPLRNSELEVGLILPVDCFDSVLGTKSNSFTKSKRKSDLLAIQVNMHDKNVSFSCVSVEAKYSSSKFSDYKSAMDQAEQSVTRFRELVIGASHQYGLIERQVLSKLIKYGLQLRYEPSRSNSMKRDRRILTKILSGEIEFISAKHEIILCSTEVALPESTWSNKDRGLWVRLSPKQWPGEHEDAQQIIEIRKNLQDLFSVGSGNPNTINHAVNESDTLSFTDVENGNVNTTLVEVPVSAATEQDNGSDTSKTEGDDVGVAHSAIVTETKLAKNSSDLQKSTDNSTLKFVLGFSKDSSERVVYQLINKNGRALDNANMMITGSSGKGKTALLKNIIYQYRQHDVNTLIFDFKNDFGGHHTDNIVFQDLSSMKDLDVATMGMPYNPLKPPRQDKGEGKPFYRLRNFINETAGTMVEFYKLGDQQKSDLIDAIELACQDNGIQIAANLVHHDNISWPTMDEVGIHLKRANKTAYNRVRELFELEIYKDDYRDVSIAELLEENYIIGIYEGFSDATRNTVALMTIYNIHKYLNSQPHRSETKYAVVIDEAHRVISSHTIASLARECRSYGVSLVLSSQNPDDFPLPVSSSLSTKIIHGNGTDTKNIKAIKGLLNLSASTGETLAELQMFEAYVANAHYPAPLIMNTFTFPLTQIVIRVKKEPNGVTLEDLKNTEGLWPSRVEFLASELCKRGVLSFEEGVYRILT